MAIIVEEKKNKNYWFILGIIALILVFLSGATYYLFFKPVPGIEEVVLSPELESISNVSKINLNVAAVTDSAIYKSLINQVTSPDLRAPGRSNPFTPF